VVEVWGVVILAEGELQLDQLAYGFVSSGGRLGLPSASSE
jgi:hypothetical protein